MRWSSTTVPLTGVWLVTGPVSATIATLTSRGWEVSTPEVWVDPTGQQWAVGGQIEDRAVIVQELQDIAVARLWATAAKGWLGGGLHSGLDEDITGLARSKPCPARIVFLHTPFRFYFRLYRLPGTAASRSGAPSP